GTRDRQRVRGHDDLQVEAAPGGLDLPRVAGRAGRPVQTVLPRSQDAIAPQRVMRDVADEAAEKQRRVAGKKALREKPRPETRAGGRPRRRERASQLAW